MKRTRAAAKIQQQNTIENNKNDEETAPKIDQTTSMVCIIFYNKCDKRIYILNIN